jgi:hypothetical protein
LKKNIPIDSAALRYISAQPIVFISENREKRPNKRKLNELLYIISKFEPNNAPIQAATHCIMNYNFMYYKFLISDTNLILNDLQSINAHVRFVTNDKIRYVASQLQLFSLVLLVSMQSLKRYPESFATILSSRTLVFYKCFKYFQKLIDESDLLSPIEPASLISCYQYLPPPGGGLLLTLDTHKTEIRTVILDRMFLITCSDSINLFILESLQNIGENKYPIIYGKNKEVETVTMTRVYLKASDKTEYILNEINGGYVIMTKSTIISIKFDTKIYFAKQFTDSELKTIFIIPDRYILVQFENRNYFELYNIFTGELVITQSFDSLIKFIICSLNNTYIVNLTTKTATEIVIALEKGELQKYIIPFTKTPAEKLSCQLLYRMPSSGIECYDLAFQVIENGGDSSMYSRRRFLATFEDGAMLFVDDELSAKNEVLSKTFKILYITTEKPGPFSILTATNYNVLVKDKRENIYLFDNESQKFRIIPGPFHHAKIIKTGYLTASFFGTVYVFYLKKTADLENKEHSVFEYAKFDAHYDNIDFMEFEGINIDTLIFISYIFFN